MRTTLKQRRSTRQNCYVVHFIGSLTCAWPCI